MEQEHNMIPEEAPPTGYIPRPRWQVWLSRVGLVVFILLLIAQFLLFFRGGGF